MMNNPMKIMVEERRNNLLTHPVTLGLVRYVDIIMNFI